MKINTTAAITVLATSLTTITFTAALATVDSVVYFSALAVLTTMSWAVSIASVTAWMDKTSKDTESYFFCIKTNITTTIPGAFHYISQKIMQSVIKSFSDAIEALIHLKITGRDIERPQKVDEIAFLR